ncbi:hypothetical protein HMPREF9977_00437 [Staphylococcus epidermidis NIHLM008]|nr:hypothetical protein HMPREF9995_08133 [Staphylococcus epidermidis NIHLM095]EJD78825.1 hypothetical protein HMPREF9993_07211 [Staphylococcus epidermidis NIHLM087]EJE11013.1 hypothetical protein HMPREF9981_03285 [Staphylococcus epidermidis NIHLM020]EJE22908.1 hypothetical protein HMPREF9977_00437 [Staphylococcus epidermidis NIHLM008]
MVEPSLSIDKQNLINAPKAPPTKIYRYCIYISPQNIKELIIII